MVESNLDGHDSALIEVSYRASDHEHWLIQMSDKEELPWVFKFPKRRLALLTGGWVEIYQHGEFQLGFTLNEGFHQWRVQETVHNN